MSRQRLRFFIGLATVVVIAVVAGVAVAVFHRGQQRVSQTTLGPVILVPGYGGSLSALQPIRQRLQSAGREVQQLSLPADGVGDLGAQARKLEQLVDSDVKAGAPSVDLVGYSAGGVTVRVYVDEDGGAAHARRVITIGSPQHGTNVASAGLLLGAGCTGGCSELQPDSDLLNRLNSGREIPTNLPWVTTWTNDDQTVVPPDSASLAGADNIDLQSICPNDHPTHSLEPRDPLVIGIVVQTLTRTALPTVSPASCEPLRALGSS